MTDSDTLRGRNILIVDDEPDILESLEEFLDQHAEKNGWVLTTRWARAELDARSLVLDTWQAPPDPGVSGYKGAVLIQTRGRPTIETPD